MILDTSMGDAELLQIKTDVEHEMKLRVDAQNLKIHREALDDMVKRVRALCSLAEDWEWRMEWLMEEVPTGAHDEPIEVRTGDCVMTVTARGLPAGTEIS